LAGLGSSRRIALGHHQQIGQFQDAGLDRLHFVPQRGGKHHRQGVGQARNVDLRLAGAHGLDDHQVIAGEIHQAHHLLRRRGQTAQTAARGG
jgi:hypothetical protein